MKTCGKCGEQASDNYAFCPKCGGVLSTAPGIDAPVGSTGSSSAGTDTLFGVLSYLGLLVFIPVFLSKSTFARFHANQGIVLVAIEIIAVVAYSILTWLFRPGIFVLIFGIARWGVLAVCIFLSIKGIIDVMQNKTTPLPVIGGINVLK